MSDEVQRALATIQAQIDQIACQNTQLQQSNDTLRDQVRDLQELQPRVVTLENRVDGLTYIIRPALEKKLEATHHDISPTS